MTMKVFHVKRRTYYFLGTVMLLSFVLASYTWISNSDSHSILHRNRAHARNFSLIELMGSRNVNEVVKPGENTVIMEPSHSKDSHSRPLAVVLVTSTARYFKHREAIRNTWGRWADDLNVRVYFTIGYHSLNNLQLLQILKEEQKIHNDLIVDNFEEGYYRLAGKILRLLKWYNATYSDKSFPRFLIKTDHDVFLNLPNIVNALRTTPYYKNIVSRSKPLPSHSSEAISLPFNPNDSETYFIGGKRFENAEVDSDPDSKWYIDSAERERLNWHERYFPTYLNGPCYVISGNAVKAIYEASFDVPIFPFEDVYLTGMVASNRLGLSLSHMHNMWQNTDHWLFLIRNQYKLPSMLTMHPIVYPAMMTKVCRKIASCRKVAYASSSNVTTLSCSSFLLLILVIVKYFYSIK